MDMEIAWFRRKVKNTIKGKIKERFYPVKAQR
jgi:hypothetical protein